jgi:hypothetical protein
MHRRCLLIPEEVWTINNVTILEEIKEAKRRGISISVNGIPYQWNQKEELLIVLEEATYMKDYIGDESGKIVQIRYDRIRLV